MCTCTAFRQNGLYFGRNMDLDYNFGEKIVATPRSFLLRYSNEDKRHLGYIGTATVIDGYPLYADAMNEKGLCVAGLDFPEKAFYRTNIKGETNVPAYDLINYIAAEFSSVSEVREKFGDINITNQPFSDKIPCATLHWMISDRESSVVIESTESGINLYDDPLDVMTNLPEFPEHMKNYERMQAEKGSALPDFPDLLSSPSRFLRIAHFRGNNLPDTDTDGVISHVFHILSTVAMPDVSRKAESGKYRKTTYSVCFDATRKHYLIKTYENDRVLRAKLKDEMLDSGALSTFEILRKQDYADIN